MNNSFLAKLSVISLSFFLAAPAMKNVDTYAPDKIYDKNKDSKITFARIYLKNEIKLQNRRNLEYFNAPTLFTFFLPQCAYTPTENLFAAIINYRIEIANPNTQKSYCCFILPYEGAKHSINKPEHTPLCTAFNPNGKIIAGGYKHTYQDHLPVPTIQIYNAQNGQRLTKFGFSNDYVSSLAYNQNGNLLASGSKNGNIIIWNLNKLNQNAPEKEATLNKNTAEIIDLIFNPDSIQLISASKNEEINIWDVLTKACLLTLTAPSEIKALALHPIKEHLIAFIDNRKICFWNKTYQKHLKNE